MAYTNECTANLEYRIQINSYALAIDTTETRKDILAVMSCRANAVMSFDANAVVSWCKSAVMNCGYAFCRP